MKFEEIKIKSINRVPPMGWREKWYGYFQMDKVICSEKLQKDLTATETLNGHQRDIITQMLLDEKADNGQWGSLEGEGYVEQQFFLNILSNLKGRVNLVELGAGRGDWCMALAGTVDFNIIDHEISSYRCMGVEAEPTHYEWMKTHFEEQGINATPVFGAVSSKNGECRFYSKEDPDSNYGQRMHESGNLIVPCYTLDDLMEKCDFGNIDILHVDIQGEEYNMLLGATEALKKKKIKYMMIGTHRSELNQQIIDYVKPYGYVSLFSVPCHSGVNPTPFGDADIAVDGLLVLESL